MAIKGIRFVHVFCQDMKRTTHFYSELLNLPKQSQEAGDSFGPPGEAQLWPMALSDAEEESKPGQVIVVMASDDVRGDYERLSGADVEFTVPPCRPYGPWEAHLRDPDGLWITLIEE